MNPAIRLGAAVTALLGGVAACDDGGGRLTLVFPNEPARAAVRRVRVDLRTSALTNPCELILARSEIVPVDSEVFEASCPVDAAGACRDGWLDQLSIPGLLPSATAIEVRGYFSEDDAAWPVVAGCVQDFDPERPEVTVRLGVYVRRNSPVQVRRGHAATGAPGEESAVPLSARVRSFPRDGTARDFYDVAGVTFVFEVVQGDLRFADGSSRAEVVAGLDGVAAAPYRRGELGTSEVVVSVPFEEDDPRPGPPVSVFISAVPEVDLNVGPPRAGLEGRPVAVRVDDVDEDGALDAILLGCRGEGACAPGEGSEPDEAFGETELRLVLGVDGSDARRTEPAPGLGWSPVGLAGGRGLTGDDARRPDIVVAEARDRGCEVRTCPADGPCACVRAEDGSPCRCEAGVVHLRRWDRGAWETPFPAARGLSTDNVIGAAAFEGPPLGDAQPGLAVATRGRIAHRQPCAAASSCPSDCSGREACRQLQGRLRCLPPPPEVRLLRAGPEAWADLASCGCLNEQVDCVPEPPFDEQTCAGMERLWWTTDPCGRRRSNPVELSPSVVPRSFAVARVRDRDALDLLFGGDRTVEIVSVFADERRQSNSILLERPVDGAMGLQLDPLIDDVVPLAPVDQTRARGDLVWWSRNPCDARADRCPRVYASPSARGCVGAAVTGGRPDVAGLDYGDAMHCRQLDLEIAPEHAIRGDFNRDGSIDLVLAEEGQPTLIFLLGDGRGGWSVPPRTPTLPAGVVGGPMASADVDGDGFSEIVMVDASSGAVHVLRPSPGR